MNRLRTLIQSIDDLVSQNPAGDHLAEPAAQAMKALVAQDDWLPASMAQPHPQYYQQHLLYADPQDRYSIVSFVWGPGQATPIHDHTVWGVIGMLRGAEHAQDYALDGVGQPLRPLGAPARLEPGMTSIVSPTHGDIHKVSNAVPDAVSISIHLYGGNIGRIQRHVFDPQTGAAKDFVSGYSRVLENPLADVLA